MSFIAFLTLVVGAVSLYADQLAVRLGPLTMLGNIFEFCAIMLLGAEVIARFLESPRGLPFLRAKMRFLASGALLVAFFVAAKSLRLSFFGFDSSRYVIVLVILRSLYVLSGEIKRIRSLALILERLRFHPARTILLSFFLVIAVGAVLLMLPVCARGGKGLSFLNALFTATSAVCVTGLTVVDTGTAFSFWGQLVILVLIQVGGLGIMILTFSTVFVARRSVSVENKLLISFMLSEDDMTQLRTTVLRIIKITFGIELVGAALLFAGFSDSFGFTITTGFDALFHSISAFCNAGFALFPTSLIAYVNDPLVSGTIAMLIILGGLSFVVLINIGQTLRDRVANLMARKHSRIRRLTLNSKVVLAMTGILISSGTLILYGTEHGNTLRSLPLGGQYLAAFFQSVTLRTAGFNSIPFNALRGTTYLVMVLYMFVGGASGSTAGGVKVGAVAVVYSFVRAAFGATRQPTLFRSSISQENISRAMIVILFGLVTVGLGTLLLSISEHDTTIQILFEATSAFGTVGLSTGITPTLSPFGKLIISILMYIGRVGPLMILSAAAQRRRKADIAFPTGEVSLG